MREMRLQAERAEQQAQQAEMERLHQQKITELERELLRRTHAADKQLRERNVQERHMSGDLQKASQDSDELARDRDELRARLEELEGQNTLKLSHGEKNIRIFAGIYRMHVRMLRLEVQFIYCDLRL